MKIVNAGNKEFSSRGEFHFKCKKCDCEWYADRTDKELHISPPMLSFYTYMNCPNCGRYTEDR